MLTADDLVLNEGEIVRVAGQEARQRLTGGRQSAVDLAFQESHGIGFQLGLPAALFLDDGPGRGTEGAVVEVGHLRIEVPVGGQWAGGVGDHAPRWWPRVSSFPQPRPRRRPTAQRRRWMACGMAVLRACLRMTDIWSRAWLAGTS